MGRSADDQPGLSPDRDAARRSDAPAGASRQQIPRPSGPPRDVGWHNARTMVARDSVTRPDPAITLPAFERLGAPPPPDLVASAIEGHSSPGDVVVDLHGRGGWVARAAVDRQRRAVSMESNPLTRLLAEIVLRPPDVRHLDAAFQALGCGTARPVEPARVDRRHVRDALPDVRPERRRRRVHLGGPGRGPTRRRRRRRSLLRKHYRCIVCRDQLGGGEQRHAPIDEDDLDRAESIHPRGHAWHLLHERFPTLDGHDQLVDQLLDLHSPRQLDGLQAILDRIDTRPPLGVRRGRAAPVAAPCAPAGQPPERLPGPHRERAHPRRPGEAARRRPVAGTQSVARVRGRLSRRPRLRPAPRGQRLRRRRRRGSETTCAASARAWRPRSCGSARRRRSGRSRPRRARPPAAPPGRASASCVGQPPQRPNQDRLSYAYLATGWLLGREAAALLPLESLFGAGGRAPWGWQAAALGRSLAAVEPWLARDARVVLFLEAGGPEALVAAALGGVRAGFRLVGARLGEPGDEVGGIVEFIPPGRHARAAAADAGEHRRWRTRRAARATRTSCPGAACSPRRSASTGARSRGPRRPQTVADTAVEILQARGEPARQERLLGEVLVGMDRAGMLRRLVAPPTDDVPAGPADRTNRPPAGEAPLGPGGTRRPARPDRPRRRPDRPSATRRTRDPGRDPRTTGPAARRATGAPRTPGSRRASRAGDRPARPHRPPRRDDGASRPRWRVTTRSRRSWPSSATSLAGRTRSGSSRSSPGAGGSPRRPTSRPPRCPSPTGWSGPCSACSRRPAASRNRPSSTGSPRCSPATTCRTRRSSGRASPRYRSLASTPDRLVTGDDLLKREPGAHRAPRASRRDRPSPRLSASGSSEREQTRRLGGRPLASWLDQRELQRLPAPRQPRSRRGGRGGRRDLVRPRRGARSCSRSSGRRCSASRSSAATPGSRQENLVRFLVIAPERTELVRYKLERVAAPAPGGRGRQLARDQVRTTPAWLAREELDARRAGAVSRPRSARRAVRRADAALRRRGRPDR